MNAGSSLEAFDERARFRVELLARGMLGVRSDAVEEALDLR